MFPSDFIANPQAMRLKSKDLQAQGSRTCIVVVMWERPRAFKTEGQFYVLGIGLLDYKMLRLCLDGFQSFKGKSSRSSRHLLGFNVGSTKSWEY